MAKFTETIRNIFKIEELRQRIGFTALMLLCVRIGSFISVPGIDVSAIKYMKQANNNTLFGLFDMFVGGAYSNAAIFALGIMPYISASIIFQLLSSVVPYFQKLQQEGEQGRKTINAYTRYAAIGLAFAQGIAVAASQQGNSPSIVAESVQGFLSFVLPSAIIFTAGTMLLMWIGDQITDKGIGNGTSLIIFIGIIARLPHSIAEEFQLALASRNFIVEAVIFVLFIAVIVLVVMFTQAVRKVPVQYAKRRVGDKMMGGQTSHIPIQLITANVMPIIFAQAIMFIPNSIIQYMPGTKISDFMVQYMRHDSWFYALVFATIIIFFTFFYTAIVFSPRNISEDMKKNGGFIPGIRPGKPTEEYLDNILLRVTVPGALFLALIAVLPVFVTKLGVAGNFASFFGGTTVLIMVGVAIDTLNQIQSYLLMRHYDGFMKSGKLRGRQGVNTVQNT
ncbi:MAG: preprotein translocase subunit SecY [Chlorobiota bacterium]|nr:preprotein translocase subunit SecY [Chlorobiota bacterium]QQS65753.1 MAG: preprotein translocase subunit SecY [Chlorobiota bacterium]